MLATLFVMAYVCIVQHGCERPKVALPETVYSIEADCEHRRTAWLSNHKLTPGIEVRCTPHA